MGTQTLEKSWWYCAFRNRSSVSAPRRTGENVTSDQRKMVILSDKPPWPLWWILLPGVMVIIASSAFLIRLMQVWDKRRVDEAEEQLKTYATDKANSDKELQKKTIELENLEGVFREKERMRKLDYITGVPNYLSWQDDVKTWYTKEETMFCFILIDLDRFKWLND